MTRVMIVVVGVLAAWAQTAAADGDCTQLDKDGATWAQKLVVRGAMAVIDCDSCSGEPVRIKKVEVRKADGDPTMRTVWIDGRAADLAGVFVQTGAETFTSVGLVLGCTEPRAELVRHVGRRGGGRHDATGIAECDRYLQLMDRFAACDKIPQATKDAMRQAADQMQDAWKSMRDPNLPAEARKAATDACVQGGDALRQSGNAMGCQL